MGLIYENDADGVTNVVHELHQYVPHDQNEDGSDGRSGPFTKYVTLF